MNEEYKKQERTRKRRNHINKDLRDLRGPFSPKMIPSGKNKEEYRRSKFKDINIDYDPEE